MGCGRSTMGSDSPSRNDKDEDWMEGSETQPSQKDPSPPSASPSATRPQTLPFNHGGALLAQAKISGSQLDFFRSLDEKIENGPDYDSEQEEEEEEKGEAKLIKKSRLKLCLEQWNQLTQGKRKEEQHNPRDADAIPLIRSTLTSPSPQVPGAVDDDSNSDSDEHLDEAISRDAVKEQYVFMGSLYTLTRLRSDGSYVPRVDVSPAHRGTKETDGMMWEDEGKEIEETTMNDVWLAEGSSASAKANGALPKMGENGNTATSPFAPAATPDERAPLRPATLALRTVFPNTEGVP